MPTLGTDLRWYGGQELLSFTLKQADRSLDPYRIHHLHTTTLAFIIGGELGYVLDNFLRSNKM